MTAHTSLPIISGVSYTTSQFPIIIQETEHRPSGNFQTNQAVNNAFQCTRSGKKSERLFSTCPEKWIKNMLAEILGSADVIEPHKLESQITAVNRDTT